MGYTANGDYDGVGNDTSYSGSDNTTRNTVKSSDDADTKFKNQTNQIVESSKELNVLNGYRSVTYNFTIAALDTANLKDPESYRNSELKYTILKSGGKGTRGITAGSKLNTTTLIPKGNAGRGSAYNDPRRADNQPLRNVGQELINEFNANSPGRFDMFIDGVEIETIMTLNENSNATLPTKIKFDIIEPYSMNGFIEAIHVAAISAGYPSYLQASFLLKMEFWGYPDQGDFSEPELIENASRYYPFGLTGIDVDVTENGTRYKCSAVPYNERAFGEPNVVKKPIKMEGETIGQILNNFFKNINEQVARSDEKSKSSSTDKHNTYSIAFPTRASTGELTDKENKNITDKKLGEILKDNVLYGMVDPASVDKPNAYKADKSKQPSADQQANKPESIKYNPKKTVIQFAEGMNISDVISSVIRDSDYVKDILKDLGKKPNVPDQYGFLDYFLIRIEVTNLDIIDDTTKKPFQNFKYLVTPYKVHYTRIPNYGHDVIKEETLKKLSNRTYNYIYTGQNIDVLNFKLNFNTLFFEAVPAEMGNKDVVGSKNAAAPNNRVDVKIKNDPGAVNANEQVNSRSNARLLRQGATQVPATPVKTIVTPIQNYTGGSASQPRDDAYSVLARNMHESVINSKASMLSGEIEILGDPYYLVTGGMGNYNPKSSGRGKTDKGEADHNYGSVLITINFRNPEDINSFEDGGMVKFDSNRVPFSGVYQVTSANSVFKDGAFKQKLNIIRMPGQVLDSNLRDSDPADRLKTEPNPDAQVIPDNTRSMSHEQRMDSVTVLEQLDRGLPSPGLPNQLSNFSAATGGLGGSTPSLLNQTIGAASNIPFPTSSIIGKSLPSDISSNIRLNSSGLSSLGQGSLSSVASIAAASNILGNQKLTSSIGSVLQGSEINSALKLSNLGSGIGAGTSVIINPASSIPSVPTANEIKEGLNINSSALSGGISKASSSISNNNISSINSLGSSGNLLNGVGDKIKSLTALKIDPQGIASTAGLNANKLSGLSGALQSKLPSQVTNIIKNIPKNVNLNQAKSSGVALDFLSATKVGNLPAMPPYNTAPTPQADIDYAKKVVEKGGFRSLENLYGVNSPTKLSTNMVPGELISAAEQSVSSARLNPLKNLSGISNLVDVNANKDKLASAQAQLSGLTGQVKIPDMGSISSVSSKFGGSVSGASPLSKLIGKG